jgi:hypothetical protein
MVKDPTFLPIHDARPPLHSWENGHLIHRFSANYTTLIVHKVVVGYFFYLDNFTVSN